MKRYLTLALAACALAPASASAWAPAATATIHPGVHDVHGGRPVHRQLRLLRRRLDLHRLRGALLGHRCRDGHQRLRRRHPAASARPVEIDGASQPGTLVYSSWVAMQSAGETDRGDLRVQRLRAGAASTRPTSRSVNPSVPGWGGPTGTGSLGGTGSTPTPTATRRCAVGVTAAQPEAGHGRRRGTPGGWSTTVYTVDAGHPR